MSRCGRCDQEKPDESFAFRFKARGVRHTICRDCHRVYRAHYNERVGLEVLHRRIRAHTERYRDRNRRYLDNYLREHPCVDCGEPDIVVLEFDHVHGDKTQAISVLVKHATSIAALRREMDKCEVRCANCHRRRTAASHHRRRARLAAADRAEAGTLDDAR